jgi:hypothetical protein
LHWRKQVGCWTGKKFEETSVSDAT